jgi:hypothetical protein
MVFDILHLIIVSINEKLENLCGATMEPRPYQNYSPRGGLVRGKECFEPARMVRVGLAQRN